MAPDSRLNRWGTNLIIFGMTGSLVIGGVMEKCRSSAPPMPTAQKVQKAEGPPALASVYYTCEPTFTPDELYRLRQKCRRDGGYPGYLQGKVDCVASTYDGKEIWIESARKYASDHWSKVHFDYYTKRPVP